MLNKVKEDFESLPTWARMGLTIGILASIVKWFPIIELLELFLMIVVIPLGFLTFLGLMSKETSNTVVNTWTAVCAGLRTEIKNAGKPPEEVTEKPQTETTEA